MRTTPTRSPRRALRQLPARWGLLCLGAALFAGCASTGTSIFFTCQLEVEASARVARPGAELVLTGGPMTEAYDTLITVGGLRAELLSVEREDCEACDDCQAEALCYACENCLECEESCSSCAQSARFIVPDVGGGEQDLVIVNGYGSSPALPLRILDDLRQPQGPLDTGDSAPPRDSGPSDTADSAEPPAAASHPDSSPSPNLVCPRPAPGRDSA